MEKGRLDYFDMAKGIGIISVVIFHSSAVPDSVVTWLASFIMPFFFFVSGMLICYKKEEEQELRVSYLKKLRSLMVPYWWFSFIYVLFDIYRIYYENGTMADVGKSILYMVVLYGRSVLWFLPVLFLAECGFLFLYRKFSSVGTILCGIILPVMVFLLKNPLLKAETAYSESLPVTAVLLFAHVLLRTALAMPFLCISYYIFRCFRGFWEEGKGFSLRQLVCGVLLILAGILLSLLNGHTDIPTLTFGFVPLYYLAASVTSAGILLICKNLRTIRPLIYLGKNSLIIMVTHLDFYFMYHAVVFAWAMDAFITRAKSYFFFFNIVFFVFLQEIPCIMLINRFFPFLLGKSFGGERNKRCKKI